MTPSVDVRFCSRCGHRLAGDVAARRLFGVLAPGPTFVLGSLLVLGAVLALVAGSLAIAILLAALAAAAFVLFYGAAERDPESPAARVVLTSGRRLRGWALFGRASADAWARATRDVARLRAESRSLHRERRRTIVALGEAAYREDQALAGALRLRLKEIDEGIAARDAARIASLAKARRLMHDEHVAVQPTRRFLVEELAPGGPAPEQEADAV